MGREWTHGHPENGFLKSFISRTLFFTLIAKKGGSKYKKKVS